MQHYIVLHYTAATVATVVYSSGVYLSGQKLHGQKYARTKYFTAKNMHARGPSVHFLSTFFCRRQKDQMLIIRNRSKICICRFCHEIASVHPSIGPRASQPTWECAHTRAHICKVIFLNNYFDYIHIMCARAAHIRFISPVYMQASRAATWRIKMYM